MPVAPEIINQLTEQKKNLESQISTLTKELQQITSALNSFSDISNLRINWSDNAMACIKEHNEFLQTNDILNCILSPELQEDEKRARNAMVALSVALNNLCFLGKLRKVVVSGVKGHFYGLPEWFENDNTLKMEYVYKINDNTYSKGFRPVIMHKGEIIGQVK